MYISSYILVLKKLVFFSQISQTLETNNIKRMLFFISSLKTMLQLKGMFQALHDVSAAVFNMVDHNIVLQRIQTSHRLQGH